MRQFSSTFSPLSAGTKRIDSRGITFFLLGTLVFLLMGQMAQARGQVFDIYGKVKAQEQNQALEGVRIMLLDTDFQTQTDAKGKFQLTGLPAGNYQLIAMYPGYETLRQEVDLSNQDLQVSIKMVTPVYDLGEVAIQSSYGTTFGITRLNAVEGTAIYAAKKNEVIVLDQLTANLATNNSRQVYAKVAGLNIWESDGAGIQLGIGGRGLSPNRNSNFNTRQNGYDISADALGYPESYYTPPVEAIERIEVVRGAASLQYGTQFGGLLNFKFKEGSKDKPFSFTSRQTVGSFGLFNSFNSVGGQKGHVNYYAFYQYKTSKGWRPNSSLEQHTAYASARIKLGSRFSIKPEYTFTTYLAQQPGGLTDTQFAADPRQSNRERNWFQVDWNLFALTLDYKFSAMTQLNSRTFGLIGGRDALGNLDNINLVDFGNNRDFLNDEFRNWGNETRLIHRYNTFDNVSVFLIGTRFYDGFTERRQGLGDDGDGATFAYLNPEQLEGSDFDLPSRNISVFAENIFQITPKFSITPGLRWEYIKTEAEGYYTNRVEDLAGNILINEQIDEQKANARSFLFAGIGLSYKPNNKLEFYGNVSQNYRAINFNDIRVNVGSLVVDPNLQDERGFNVDLGVRGNIPDLLNFDVSVFHLAYQDRIGTILQREPNPQFNNLVDRVVRFRTNIADANIYGLESFAELNLVKLFSPDNQDFGISIFSNIAFIHAEYVNADQNGVEGNEVELVPQVNLKTGLTFSWNEFKLSYQYSFVEEHFSDASNAIRTPTAIEGIIPSYSVMDLSASYTYRFLKLETGVNNLSNNFYFTRRATGYPGPGIIPSDGRSFYLTLQVQL